MEKRNNNIADLTKLEINIANKLIDLLKEKEYVSYEELASYFGIRADHISNQLENIDMICHRIDIPLISANVVNKGTDQPNMEGFLEIFNKCGIEMSKYDNVIKEAREFKDWDILSKELRRIYNTYYI